LSPASSGGSGRSGGSGGRKRKGTGGYGRRRLEGKGPTPPAERRIGHPAQRRLAAQRRSGTPQGQPGAGQRRSDAAQRSADAPQRRSGGPRRQSGSDAATAGAARPAARGRPASRARGADTGPEVVAGRNPVLESLRAAVPATALYVVHSAGAGDRADDRIAEAVTLASDAGIPLLEAGRPELDRLTGGAVHQGIALRVPPYDYAHPGDLTERAAAVGEQPLIVALDGVTDAGNLGAVARSAAAFGAHGVLIPSRRSAGVTTGTWKASAGALSRLPVAQAPNLTRALASYQDAGLFVVGLDGAGATTVAGLEVADGPLVLVAGAEGRGLSRLVADRCDLLARIPIAADTESLNIAVATGIALYEVSQRRSPSPAG
jgi:23S rRNA (guanosine2251-2'-O)-methyltransferase